MGGPWLGAQLGLSPVLLSFLTHGHPLCSPEPSQPSVLLPPLRMKASVPALPSRVLSLRPLPVLVRLFLSCQAWGLMKPFIFFIFF